eukprot:1876342-Prymnesium_polylepis.1
MPRSEGARRTSQTVAAAPPDPPCRTPRRTNRLPGPCHGCHSTPRESPGHSHRRPRSSHWLPWCRRHRGKYSRRHHPRRRPHASRLLVLKALPAAGPLHQRRPR